MDPGFLAPADHVLTDRYLGEEIAGHPVVSTFIHRADVYSAVPEELVSGRQLVRDDDHNDACYIISPVRYAGKKKTRKLRRIDGDPRKSCWHSEKGKIPLEGSKIGGYVQDFVHAIKGTDGRIERLGWRMKEYGLSTEEHGDIPHASSSRAHDGININHVGALGDAGARVRRPQWLQEKEGGRR
ncbi:hypothetical protein ACQ4PT_018993 [Festuca glaucescens]